LPHFTLSNDDLPTLQFAPLLLYQLMICSK
jgi:hypothetical protein